MLNLSTIKKVIQKQQKEDPAGLLTKAYVSAFLLIAALSIMVHFITAHMTDIQAENTRISFYVSQDRSYIERISLYTARHFADNADLDFNFIKQTTEEMKKSHGTLKALIENSSASLGSNKMLKDAYFGDKFRIEEHTQEFLANIKTYTGFATSHQHPTRIAAKDVITKRSQSLLIPLLNQALEDYQRETLALIDKFSKIQSIGTAMILIVLLLEAVFIFRPLVAKIRKYNIMLSRQALEDPLTGLSNRRAFIKRAEFELKKSKRTNTLMIVVLADLDYFKQVNDTHGHDVGDRVLKHFSKVLVDSLRAGDVVGRIGGEEFGIVLPATDHAMAQTILDRLCETVAQTPCKYETENHTAKSVSYTTSLGFVTKVNSDESSIDELLKKADEALYKAKEQGRNRAVSI